MISIASPELSADVKARVEEVLESGMLADGPEVRTFEDQFAAHCNVDHGVATSNGTTALHTALHTLGIGPGDRVLTTPFSFIASANAIRLAGAEPVFADIDPQTFNLDPDAAATIAEAKSVDAILVVHLYGLPAAMGAFKDLADRLEVPLIEDAAQAHGARYDGEPIGSFGDAACFSFYPTKNMTTGEGGMVVTDRTDVAERASSFVNHGRTESGSTYEHAQVGHNFRMTSMAAVIGQEQLERLPEFNEARRQNATILNEGIEHAGVMTPVEPEGRRHVYHQYTIRSDDRDGLRQHLEDAGIGTGIYYPQCIHEQPPYVDLDHTAPNAESASRTVLSLPVHPGLDRADLDTIVNEVNTYNAD